MASKVTGQDLMEKKMKDIFGIFWEFYKKVLGKVKITFLAFALCIGRFIKGTLRKKWSRKNRGHQPREKERRKKFQSEEK